MSEKIRYINEQTAKASHVVETYRKVSEALSRAPYPYNVVVAYIVERHQGLLFNRLMNKLKKEQENGLNESN